MSGTAYIPFGERPEWNDVHPIKQDDGPYPVAAIQYSPRYVDTMNYFRAIWFSRECSQRALDLTAEAIELNPANYTAWHMRRLCLWALNVNLSQELDWISQFGEESGSWKNYQLWHHRKQVVMKLNDWTREFDFVRLALDNDAKNYHAWSYRQWVVRNFGLWEGEHLERELSTTAESLKNDVRNNSAWCHRWFCFTRGGGSVESVLARNQIIDMEWTIDETIYVLSTLDTVQLNESAWNYLRAIVKLNGGWESVPLIVDQVENMIKKNNENTFAMEAASEFKSVQQSLHDGVPLSIVFLLRCSDLQPTRERYWTELAKLQATDLQIEFQECLDKYKTFFNLLEPVD